MQRYGNFSHTVHEDSEGIFDIYKGDGILVAVGFVDIAAAIAYADLHETESKEIKNLKR